MDVTKPYEFIGFGAMDVTKPCEFIGFGAADIPRKANPMPYQALTSSSSLSPRIKCRPVARGASASDTGVCEVNAHRNPMNLYSVETH